MPMYKKELEELQEVPEPKVLFEDSVTDDTDIRQVSTAEDRKKELEQKLQQRLADPNWGVGFKGGVDKININGRPKIPELTKLTNKQVRQKELLNLCRKIKPHLTKSVKVFVDILENPESSESNKLKAAQFMMTFYKELVTNTFDRFYDDDHAKEVQEDNTSMFTLKMIDSEDK